jgi:hypothetical protein
MGLTIARMVGLASKISPEVLRILMFDSKNSPP